MSEFDDVDETDGEADETGAADIEVGAWCVAGLVAFDAAAGLDFPDELSGMILGSVLSTSFIDAYEISGCTTYSCVNKLETEKIEVFDLGYTIDDASGTVISFYAQLNGNVAIENAEEERTALMEKYLSYTTLDALGDWSYNGARYFSKKAGLYLNVELSQKSDRIFIGLER